MLSLVAADYLLRIFKKPQYGWDYVLFRTETYISLPPATDKENSPKNKKIQQKLTNKKKKKMAEDRENRKRPVEVR